MPRSRLLLALLIVLLAAAEALALRPVLPTLQREADATGRTYVLMHVLGEFRVLRRAASLPNVQSETAWNSKDARRLEADPLDQELARGKLRLAPFEMRVRPDGAGFVALGDRMRRRSGREQVTVIDRNGEVSASLTGHELFEERDATPNPADEEWFVASSWLTADGGSLVVMGLRVGWPIERAVRRVDLDTGEVSAGSHRDVARGFFRTHDLTRREAFDAADFLDSPELAPALRRLRADRSAPLGLRARAELELIELGLAEQRAKTSPRLTRLALALPRPDGVTEDDREELIEGLPHLLPSEAPELLRELLGTHEEGDWYAALGGVQALGDDAVPVLADVLKTDPRRRARRGAALALGRSYRREALSSLLGAAAHESDGHVASEALCGAYRLVGQEVGPHLLGLLRAGTTADWQIVTLLERVHSPKTIPLLIDRLREESERPMPILNALRFQTCKDLGDDPADWLHWWDER